jgi:hypothetical protein
MQQPETKPMADARYGSAEKIMALSPERLAAILRDKDASVYARAKACQQLAVTGGRAAVGAIAPLLADAQLSHYARFALEPNPDPSAAAALRDALSKVQGALLVGVINSIGVRRDTEAIGALSRLVRAGDVEVARAANEALARIRPRS